MLTPDQISGLQGWWKADAITGLSDGATLASWTDSSGNGRTLTATGTLTYETSEINGLPAAHFTGGSGNYLSVSFTVAQPFTVFFVARRDGDNGTTQTPVGSNGASDVAFFFTNDARLGLYAGTGTIASNAGQGLDAEHVYSVVANGGSSILNIDGAQASTGGAGSNGLTGITLGSKTGHDGEWFGGEVAEVLVYSGALTAGDRAHIHTYLSDKYAISVSDHLPVLSVRRMFARPRSVNF